MTQLFTVRVPALRMPPPLFAPTLLPFEIVSPDIVTVAPDSIVKIVPTVASLLPETVILAAPGPVMVVSAVIPGRGLSSLMVPVRPDLKLIMLPALTLAFVIASRNEPLPLSFVFVTVNVPPVGTP